MYLLHTTTLQLHEFIGSDLPKYAILSHTWGDDEVLFRHIWNSQVPSNNSAGFLKIGNACAKAKEDGWEYIWIDTCCINKESSAELSESINSMYKWYKNAEICYAFLADVSPGRKEFKDSRWFTRGWTLQELLAPSTVRFYNGKWDLIGYKGVDVKDELQEMSKEICAVTDIDRFTLTRGLLLTQEPYVGPSVAQRLSWVARRQTKRSEDMSYCMLGIFDVNMPLLYGEGGEKAFMRLQSEIIKVTTDESIFAWSNPSLWTSGLLARSPLEFAASGRVHNFTGKIDGLDSGPYRSAFRTVSMTSRGQEFEIPVDYLLRKRPRYYYGHFEVPLSCGTYLAGSTAKDRYIALHFAIINVENEGRSDKREDFFAVRTGLEQLHMIDYSLKAFYRTQTRSCYFQDRRSTKADDYHYIQFLPQLLPSPTTSSAPETPVLILKISKRMMIEGGNLSFDLSLQGKEPYVINHSSTRMAPPTHDRPCGLFVGGPWGSTAKSEMLLTWRHDSNSQPVLEICTAPNKQRRISVNCIWVSTKLYFAIHRKENFRGERRRKMCLLDGDDFTEQLWPGRLCFAFSTSLVEEKPCWTVEIDYTKEHWQ